MSVLKHEIYIPEKKRIISFEDIFFIYFPNIKKNIFSEYITSRF